MATTVDVQQLLEQDIPVKFRAPGCAMAVLKEEQLIAKHVWGYANLDTRAPVTSSTVFPICSISKQMVCLVLTELIEERGPGFTDKLYEALKEVLPESVTSNKDLTIEALVGMRSGLRDYWALSVLWGATPQDRFSIYQDAPKALKRAGGFHFAPGTQMSYSNTNFVAVGLAIERATGQTLNDLLQERVFDKAGMKTAALRPDTARIPAPLVGYEGTESTGYIPYANRIEWAADAGIQASLDDMIAYEQYIHRSAGDKESSYFKNAVEPKYIDGKAANYGQGLVHGDVEGIKFIGHSGGLAGFRLRRVFVPSAKLSVIVLLNSETDSKAVMDYALKKLVGTSGTQTQVSDSAPKETSAEGNWTANYFDEEARLAVVVKQDKPGEVTVNYSGHDEKLRKLSGTESASPEMQIRSQDGSLSISRPLEHRQFTARPLASTRATTDVTAYIGEYYSAEIESTLHITGSGGMLYGAFDGYLGQGPAHLMRWIGEDVWWLACFRSLDAPSPGNWTVAFRSKGGQGVSGLTIGCWLARMVEYKKVK